MMRRIQEGYDVVSDVQGNHLFENAKEYFLEHIPEKYKPFCKYINHVDTQVRNDSEGKHWRVQGYIEIWDFLNVEKDTKYSIHNTLEGTISIEKDAVCFWTIVVPFKD